MTWVDRKLINSSEFEAYLIFSPKDLLFKRYNAVTDVGCGVMGVREQTL